MIVLVFVYELLLPKRICVLLLSTTSISYGKSHLPFGQHNQCELKKKNKEQVEASIMQQLLKLYCLHN